jgi:hypothetical protein
MAAKTVFPYHPVNKFHAGIKANFEAAAETPESIDLLTGAVKTGSTGTQAGFRKVAEAIDRITGGESSDRPFERLITAIETLATGMPDGEAIGTKLNAIGDALNDLDRTVQSFGLPEKDNVTALYAGAVDTTGDIVGRTHVGQWLNEAKFKSLQDIADLHKTKPQRTRRDEFIKRMRAVDPVPPGLPAVVTDGELARFFELAPAVLKAINDSQAASSAQSQPPSSVQTPPTTKA